MNHALFFRLIFCMVVLGGLLACMNDEKNTSKNEATGTIEFKMNINEMTKATAGCLTDDSLRLLADAGLLKATVTVLKATQTEPEQLTIGIRYINGGFVGDPIELPRGSNVISQFTVHHQNNDLYFASVSEGAPYAQYVTRTLPQVIVIGNQQIYKKTSVDVYVLCTFNENAQDFGYIKWNIHFVRLFCLPFSVNVCNQQGEDVVGSGILTIEQGDYIGGIFSNADTLSMIAFPPATPGLLSDLCFPYDNLENPATTYMRITMQIDQTDETVSSIVNVATLLTYKEQPEWSDEFNYLHFWFCNCETWFFANACDPVCVDNLNINLPDLNNTDLITAFRYFDGTYWQDGVGAAYQNPGSGLLLLIQGESLRTKEAVRIYKQNALTSLSIKATVMPALPNTLAFTVNLVDQLTGLTVGSKPIYSAGSNLAIDFPLNASDFPDAVDGRCYWIEISVPQRGVLLESIVANKVTL